MTALRALAQGLLTAVTVLGIVVVLWVVGLRVFDVSEFVGKGPDDVWRYLVTDEDAGEARAEALALLGRTLLDASLGFVCGMVAAVVLAAGIVLSRGIEGAVMPLAMVLRSVPLIALAPILILLVGRGPAVVAVMSGVVVLFPALVGIVVGLRSASAGMRDVVQVYGGGPWAVLRRVSLPSALPSVFAAVRVAVPGAVTGALLAEWLATGKGMGYAVVSAASRAQVTRVWGLVVVLTLASLLLYLLAQLVESLVLARSGVRPRS